VVVKNIKTGEEYNLNEHEKYDAASLYKLWVMASAYKQMNDGRLKKDEILSDSIANINDSFNIASDEAELTDGEIETTVSSAINQMITISHNYSALILSRRVGSSYISNYIDQLGLKESSFNAPPQTTASDIALFYEKLYKKKLVDDTSSIEMIETLKKQQLNDRIPKKLPQHITVAHKTGELGWAKHDAGIVFTPQGDYIIVVLSESDFPAGAAERIADLSKAVYEYFESN
jgi:beta-lactamase class A